MRHIVRAAALSMALLHDGGLPAVEFKDVPFFFRSGRTIVLYVETGSPVDATVEAVLRDRLGERYVGRE